MKTAQAEVPAGRRAGFDDRGRRGGATDGSGYSPGGPRPAHAGPLVARLADCSAEVDAAQALRYAVFFEEMDAVPTAQSRANRRDEDEFDALCDHLLVIDRSRGNAPAGVVGTYRLLRSAAARRCGFYTSGEFDISALLAHGGELLELGRSCVHPDYRNRPTMQLMWRAIANYVFHYRIGLMFGCASFRGTDANSLALPLSWLHYAHLAPPELRPVACEERYTDMRLISPDEIDPGLALSRIPPLLKGYLRLGGFVGDGAVIDDQFNTTDVCVVVKTDRVTDRYYKHYERASQTATEH